MLHLELTNAVAAARGAENIVEGAFLTGDREKTNVAADNLPRTVAVHVLGPGVPGSDDSFQVLTDNGVVGRFHDGREPANLFLGAPAFGDVKKSDDGSDVFAIAYHWIGPVLGGKRCSVSFPKYVRLAVKRIARFQTQMNWTFFDGIRSAVLTAVVHQLVHVSANQFRGMVVAEHAGTRGVAERAIAVAIVCEDSFRGGIE